MDHKAEEAVRGAVIDELMKIVTKSDGINYNTRARLEAARLIFSATQQTPIPAKNEGDSS
ncbi:MAG: hypothetical protein ACK47B_23770 [Armatimonadota bacterium]